MLSRQIRNAKSCGSTDLIKRIHAYYIHGVVTHKKYYPVAFFDTEIFPGHSCLVDLSDKRCICKLTRSVFKSSPVRIFGADSPDTHIKRICGIRLGIRIFLRIENAPKAFQNNSPLIQKRQNTSYPIAFIIRLSKTFNISLKFANNLLCMCTKTFLFLSFFCVLKCSQI